MFHKHSVSLRLTRLDDRLVPTASSQLSDFSPLTSAQTFAEISSPMPIAVGTADNGETIYSVTVLPTRCTCSACRSATGMPASDAVNSLTPSVPDPKAISSTATIPSSTVPDVFLPLEISHSLSVPHETVSDAIANQKRSVDFDVTLTPFQFFAKADLSEATADMAIVAFSAVQMADFIFGDEADMWQLEV